jgi:hypothetical protein
MSHLYHHEKGPGHMPTHGRCSRQVCDGKLKVKVRRQERRKFREVIRTWLGDGITGEHAN